MLHADACTTCPGTLQGYPHVCTSVVQQGTLLCRPECHANNMMLPQILHAAATMPGALSKQAHACQVSTSCATACGGGGGNHAHQQTQARVRTARHKLACILAHCGERWALAGRPGTYPACALMCLAGTGQHQATRRLSHTTRHAAAAPGRGGGARGACVQDHQQLS